jgi:hypothetical protein
MEQLKFDETLYQSFFAVYKNAQTLLLDCTIENISKAKELLELCLHISQFADWKHALSNPSLSKSNLYKSSVPLSSV